MLVSDFHFDLPEELIAQHPPAERGSSRMLVLDRGTGALADEQFRDLPRLLRAGDLLILNDSRVLPARLFATRGGLATQVGSPRPSGVVEVLLTELVEGQGTGNREQGTGMVWRVLVKPARKVRVGERLEFHETPREQNAGILLSAQNDKRGDPGHDKQSDPGPVLTAEVVAAGEFGERTLRFAAADDFYERVGRIGHMPLPPYIRRDQAGRPDTEEDRERYQTVFSQKAGAHEPGSAAAPTAGLHFTPEVLDELEAAGVEIGYLTLHVGLGTFQPVRVERLEDIRLHAERYTLPAATAEALNRALADGRRVVAVGTTTTRTLEHIGAQAAGVGTKQEGVPQGLKPACSGAVDGTGEPVPLSKTSSSAAYEGEIAGGTGWEEMVPRFEAHSGSTSIFLAPGHRFRVVSGLLTNFHLPESTLLMLVSAFAGETDQGRRTVLAAYEHAIREGYRFYSYGDCMLVL